MARTMTVIFFCLMTHHGFCSPTDPAIISPFNYFPNIDSCLMPVTPKDPILAVQQEIHLKSITIIKDQNEL